MADEDLLNLPELLDYQTELKQLDELECRMMELDESLREALLRSELLNLDIATMFEPKHAVAEDVKCSTCTSNNES